MKFFELEERTLQKGIRQGKAEDILDFLCELGEVPTAVREQIYSQKEDAILRSWLKLAARAESIKDFEQKAFSN